jgi:DNA-binding response OmpR family regulator
VQIEPSSERRRAQDHSLPLCAIPVGKADVMESALVLIVDDNADQRAIAGAFLRHAGYRTLEADSARSGEALLATHTPDVVMLDLHMPLKSGLQLLRDIAPVRRSTGMGVVIYSSFTDLYRSELEEIGVDAMLNKSATPQEFIAVIDGIVKRPRAQPGDLPA